jgi:hypothetical protein
MPCPAFHRTLRGFAAINAAIISVSCTASPSPKYERKMAQLRSIVPIGSDIYQAKRNLEREGFETSEIYDPTKLGKVLSMDVDFGILPGSLDALLYAADIEHPSAPISGLVEATPAGKVIEIR